MSEANLSENAGGLLARDPQASTLWERLRHFSFDRGDGPRTFARRLAEEQGWSAEFAARAIEEYRHFLLLFALGDKEGAGAFAAPSVRIVPSAVVDKVWHLHLLYTESYWGTLCGEILGRPLHHQPADGSGGEATSLGTLHQANMETYRTTFGKEPPADIWPGTHPARVFPAARTIPVGVILTLLAGATAIGLGFCLNAGWTPEGGYAWMVALCALSVVGFVAGLYIDGQSATAAGSGGSHRITTRRRRVRAMTGGDAYFFGGGDSGGVTVIAGDSSSHHGPSHDAHVGVSDGGGHSHSCGGHSCGGHSCGGHGCGGH